MEVATDSPDTRQILLPGDKCTRTSDHFRPIRQVISNHDAPGQGPFATAARQDREKRFSFKQIRRRQPGERTSEAAGDSRSPIKWLEGTGAFGVEGNHAAASIRSVASAMILKCFFKSASRSSGLAAHGEAAKVLFSRSRWRAWNGL